MVSNREDVLTEVARLEEQERMCLAQAEHSEVEERWALAAFWHMQAKGFGDRADSVLRIESIVGPVTVEVEA